VEHYYIWFLVFAFLAYFIITDDSAVKAFYFISQIVKSKYGITKWWLMNNPHNPVVKYMIWRRSIKLAKELEKELNARRK